jgi:hypothetical protein
VQRTGANGFTVSATGTDTTVTVENMTAGDLFFIGAGVKLTINGTTFDGQVTLTFANPNVFTVYSVDIPVVVTGMSVNDAFTIAGTAKLTIDGTTFEGEGTVMYIGGVTSFAVIEADMKVTGMSDGDIITITNSKLTVDGTTFEGMGAVEYKNATEFAAGTGINNIIIVTKTGLKIITSDAVTIDLSELGVSYNVTVEYTGTYAVTFLLDDSGSGTYVNGGGVHDITTPGTKTLENGETAILNNYPGGLKYTFTAGGAANATVAQYNNNDTVIINGTVGTITVSVADGTP